MFCANCGKELESNAKFCQHCGTPVAAVSSAERKVKKFHFSSFTRNASNEKEINQWLALKSIRIRSIRLTAFGNDMLPLFWETTINYLEIEYEEVVTDQRYQMGHFSSAKWLGKSFERVERMLEKWVSDYPNRNVVYKHNVGHQMSGGNTQSVFFFYECSKKVAMILNE